MVTSKINHAFNETIMCISGIYTKFFQVNETVASMGVSNHTVCRGFPAVVAVS